MTVPVVLSQVVLAALLTGCTGDGVCHGLYEALVRQHCAERPGQPVCAGDHKTYDDYRQARAHLLRLHEAFDYSDPRTGSPTDE